VIDEGFMHSNYVLELLFKCSRDGYKAEDFHRICDGKENTLSVIESHKGKIFGFFASIAWETNGDWKIDAKAWLFSLTHKSVHR